MLNPLHIFTATPDGSYPGRVTIGPDSALYLTTSVGGGGAGAAYSLKSPATACRTSLCPWTETLLYAFQGCFTDATGGGQLSFDQHGRMYGTSWGCGTHGGGAVYQLTPAGGAWNERVLYNFEIGIDGSNPVGTITPDESGHLYGTLFTYAAIFQLTPASTENESVVHRLQNDDGCDPHGGLLFDPSGAMYGSTSYCGILGGGTIFKLMPSGSGWSFSVLYNMPGDGATTTNGNLVMDAAGNLYGTTLYGGQYDMGSVFKLTPSGQGWIYTSLHDFTGAPNDGAYPADGVTLGGNGKIYGTTPSGGLALCSDINMVPGCGVVFEITP